MRVSKVVVVGCAGQIAGTRKVAHIKYPCETADAGCSESACRSALRTPAPAAVDEARFSFGEWTAENPSAADVFRERRDVVNIRGWSDHR